MYKHCEHAVLEAGGSEMGSYLKVLGNNRGGALAEVEGDAGLFRTKVVDPVLSECH